MNEKGHPDLPLSLPMLTSEREVMNTPVEMGVRIMT
jgi:hypothetical protein